MMDGARRPGRPKGTPKTGGRVAGVRNKTTRLREQAMVRALVESALTPEQIAELTPLDVLLRIMRSAYQAGDVAAAQAAAMAAAPYVHAKLSSSDVRITDTNAAKSDEQVDAEIAAIHAKLAAARVVN